MKAKEYAEKYLKSENKDDTIVSIGREFMQEIVDISKSRNVIFGPGLIAILNELNKKWMKFAELVNKKYPVTEPIKYDGFRNLLEIYSPKMHILWTNNNG